MKTNPTMLGIEANVAQAAKTMCHDEVGSVIILERNRPIGIVTEEDITCKVVSKDLKPSTVRVNEIMSTPLITVSADKTVGDAAHNGKAVGDSRYEEQGYRHSNRAGPSHRYQ
jgi:CBS domain-containing protein